VSTRRNLVRMRHRLLIKIIGRVPDGGGGFARSDTAGETVWARVDTIGTLEANTYAQLQQRATHKALIRWRDDIAQGQTVVWKRPAGQGGDLNLYVVTAKDADPDGRPGEFLLLVLREGGNL